MKRPYLRCQETRTTASSALSRGLLGLALRAVAEARVNTPAVVTLPQRAAAAARAGVTHRAGAFLAVHEETLSCRGEKRTTPARLGAHGGAAAEVATVPNVRDLAVETTQALGLLLVELRARHGLLHQD